MRAKQINLNNYLAFSFLYEGFNGVIIIDLLNKRFIDFQLFSNIC